MPEPSNWNTPIASPRASIAVRQRVVERDRGDVGDTGELARLVDHVEVAQAEEVDLEQADRLDHGAGELRHDLLVGALPLERDEVHERLGADDDGGGVDAVLPRQPFERLREVDDLARDLLGVVRLLQLGARLEAVVERLAGAFGDELRDAVDRPVRMVEHAPGVAHGGAGGHRPERDDLGDVVAAVLVARVVDDALAALDGEVEIHVGHRLAAGIEHPLEEEAVDERVDVGDLEAVRDEAAGRRAAARPDADAVAAGERDEVGDDEEVVGEAHLLDRLELELEALAVLGRRRAVALRHADVDEVDEVLERVLAVRRVEAAGGGSGRARSRRCTLRQLRACAASRRRGRGSRAPSPRAS